MYKKMLVPLDTSSFAECVLDHVREIATARSIPEVNLLSVVEPVRQSTVAYFGEDRAEEAESSARKGAAEYLSTVRQKLGLTASDVKTLVVSGQPADAILDFIDENGVDLVVMSSRGRSGVSKWLLGNTVERVLRRSSAPVFLVPPASCRLPVK